MPRSRRIRFGLALLTAAAGLLSSAAPVQAIERILLRLPLLQTDFSVNVRELRDPAKLLRGSSDLAQIDQATNGAVGRQLLRLFTSPLPIQTSAVARNLVGTPMLDQVLLMLSTLGKVDGLPKQPDGQLIEQTLQRAAASPGGLTLVDVLEALPGRSVSVNLEVVVRALDRLVRQQQAGLALAQQGPVAAADARLSSPGPNSVVRSQLSLPVAHRQVPLQLVLIAPSSGGNGRLVAISHGLWDSPRSFEGWGRHLASHGYTVVLPSHPDSDRSQQMEMLAGQAPPPTPEQLRLRPLDISALIDAAAAGRLALPAPVRTDAVAVLGQSWGATTALQLAGVRPSAARLKQHCQNPLDPDRNISWVLQCNFQQSANQAWVPDQRVKAVVAVSPMLSLLFDRGSVPGMNAQALVVSGTRDWVVPSGPEAVLPLQRARAAGGLGNRLVLAAGGDHFNLGSRYEEGGGPLRGLLLAWVQAGLNNGAPTPPGAGAAGATPSWLPATGWGDASVPLVDVSNRLDGLPRPSL